MSLTKDDLKEGGFEPLGVRKKIENVIKGWQTALSSFTYTLCQKSMIRDQFAL